MPLLRLQLLCAGLCDDLALSIGLIFDRANAACMLQSTAGSGFGGRQDCLGAPAPTTRPAKVFESCARLCRIFWGSKHDCNLISVQQGAYIDQTLLARQIAPKSDRPLRGLQPI